MPNENVLTDEQIAEALTIPGLNVEAALEPREMTLLYAGIRALLAAHPGQPEPRAEGTALGYAQRLATGLWEKHWRDSAPQWKVLDDTLGVLTQIDNMVCDLQRTEATDAVRDVLAERRRQIEQEGWTTAHDDAHLAGDLALASACYAIQGSGRWAQNSFMWPWPAEWWKPTTKRRDMVKSVALGIAEIERLDRDTARTGASS